MTSMTAFTTPYCTNLPDLPRHALWALRAIAVAALLWLQIPISYADGITVGKSEMRIAEDGYQVTADFGIGLNFVVEQALTHGIPLYFTSELSLTRPRWYWLDEEVMHSEQVGKLSYNILTRQYRITRGALFQNFDSLEDALRVFGHQVFPSIPASQVKPGNNYVAAIRMSLDISQLPKPLQVNALATKDWDMDSGWHRWTVHPSSLAVNAGSAVE